MGDWEPYVTVIGAVLTFMTWLGLDKEFCAYPVDSARSSFNHTGMEHRFQGFGSPMTVRRVGPYIRPRVALQATTHEQEAIWSKLRCAERTGDGVLPLVAN